MMYHLDHHNVYVEQDHDVYNISSHVEIDLNFQHINHNKNNDEYVVHDHVRFQMFHIPYNKMDKNFLIIFLFHDESILLLLDNKFHNRLFHQ
jgi:hypothetical protein